MGCTQSREVSPDVTYPNRHKLDHYGRSLPQEQHPESTKSSNTAGSTTSNTSSNDLYSYSTTPPINTSSTAFDFEYEMPLVYEMTTEDDPTMIRAINRLEDRLSMDSPVKKRRTPRYEEDEEFLTDDFYEEVPNMDDYLNQSSVESSALMLPPQRKLDYSKYTKLVDEEEAANRPADESEDEAFHRRSLAVHAEQQKRLSVIHMLLPWTHAIAVRKQRHIHSRQFMRSSFVGLSLLMWPQMMSSKNRPTKIRTYNPCSLFRR
jgi:hypothetical protein